MASVTKVYARRSANFKYVICGECRRSLCRRDATTRPGGPPQLVDGKLVPGTEHVYVLRWEDGWHVIDRHLEFSESAQSRLAKGNKPGRRDWLNADRNELTRARREFLPAVCRWCGELNEIDPKRLDVVAIGAY